MSGCSPLLSRSVNSPAIWPSRVSTEGDEDAPLGGERGCNEVSRIVAPPLTRERERTEKTSHGLNNEQTRIITKHRQRNTKARNPKKRKRKGRFLLLVFAFRVFVFLFYPCPICVPSVAREQDITEKNQPRIEHGTNTDNH